MLQYAAQVMWAEAVAGRNVHVETGEALQQTLDPHQIVQGKGACRVVVDENVQIAVAAFFAPRPRSENIERNDTLLPDFVRVRSQLGDDRG